MPEGGRAGPSGPQPHRLRHAMWCRLRRCSSQPELWRADSGPPLRCDFWPPTQSRLQAQVHSRVSPPDARGIRCDPHRLGHFLRTQLSPQLLATCWDIILVDAPNGWGPGRMGAIYAASQLAGDSTVIFVDDCERMLEGNYALWYLSQGRELRVIDNGHGAITCMMYTAVK